MLQVQIFGIKGSQETRAAERFFKERRITLHFVDLKQKPMSAGEIQRFIDKFGLPTLLDESGKAFVDAGLKYIRLSESEMRARIEKEPRLLRLPLVRGGKLLSIGHDEAAWGRMISDGTPASARPAAR